MIKAVAILACFATAILADVHFAKLEPLDTVTIKAEASGKAIDVKSNLEGKKANGLIVHIDDSVNREDLKHSKESLLLIDKMIKINQQIAPMLKKSFEKKLNLYQKVAPLSSSSVSTKDNLYSAYISAKAQYSATLEKILNLKNQKVSLEQKIVQLKDIIAKKSIYVKDKYLYSLNVKRGEFITVGMPLAVVQDISKAKLTIYLNEDELSNLDTKTIYINGKKSNLKFSKVWKVADKKYISSYRAEIILDAKDRFSKLIKVEVK